MDSTRRFSDRVENYIRYRPGYPDPVVDEIARETGLSSDWTVVDVGSGTGISSAVFLRHGNTVYGVEPNAPMREAAERAFAGNRAFLSVDGTAEATGLPAEVADIVVAGQAFHWFDPPRAREEFRRILRPNGWVALIWNSRRTDSTPFLREYEALLMEHGTDYAEVQHTNIDIDRLREFFAEGWPRKISLPNEQRFDYEGLKGRLLSSSYTPAEGDPRRAIMLTALRDLFDRREVGGEVVIEYDTEIFLGKV